MAATSAGAVIKRHPFLSNAEESARLSALRAYRVLDTGRESRFDDLTGLAANICEAPISLLSLVEDHRLFFKSAYGVDLREVPYPDFCCGYAIRGSDVFQVHDTASDRRFADHPMVVDSPGIQSYAGALITQQGHALGVLCVADRVPRA
jgi:GAF domain-containing protein